MQPHSCSLCPQGRLRRCRSPQATTGASSFLWFSDPSWLPLASPVTCRMMDLMQTLSLSTSSRSKIEQTQKESSNVRVFERSKIECGRAFSRLQSYSIDQNVISCLHCRSFDLVDIIFSICASIRRTNWDDEISEKFVRLIWFSRVYTVGQNFILDELIV